MTGQGCLSGAVLWHMQLNHTQKGLLGKRDFVKAGFPLRSQQSVDSVDKMVGT